MGRTESRPTLETESDTMEPSYRCEFCGKVFRTPEARDDHLYSVGLVY